MKVHTDPLVDDYLRRLNAAASTLPADERDELVSEIREHLEEALRQYPAGDQAAVHNALERLGSPEEIAAAAADPAPGQPAGAVSQINGLAIASVVLAVLWFAGLGAVLALVFGYRARRQINHSAGSQTGSGLATAGIILGWIGIAIVVTVVILISLHPNKPH
jgi:Domain of unknown function (DUF4190)